MSQDQDSNQDLGQKGVLPREWEWLRRRKRPRSARRLRHEAQAQVFENQAGSLEDIRSRLGLRPSQICELLKVHPSAWTRWTRTGRGPPPHIHQMLEWYLELLKWRGQYGGKSIQEDPRRFVPPSRPVDVRSKQTVIFQPPPDGLPFEHLRRPGRLGLLMILLWATQILVAALLLTVWLRR